MNPSIVKKSVSMRRREVMVNIIGKANLEYEGEENMSVEYTTDYWIKAMDECVASNPDIILLPERCDVHSSIPDKNIKYRWLDRRGDYILNAFSQYAKKHSTYLVYPTHRTLGDGKYGNCSILIDRQGDVVAIYDKVFPTVGEIDLGIVPGVGPVVADTDFGTLGFAICFDLNFWELLDGYVKASPDVIAFCSQFHGGPMQQVWAYRCQSFFLGATAGRVEKNIVAPDCEIRRQEYSYYDSIMEKINTNCMLCHLDFNRPQLRNALNKYGRKLTLHNTNGLGCVLLTSEDENLPIESIVEEMKIEPWKDYYVRSFDKAAANRPDNSHICK